MTTNGHREISPDRLAKFQETADEYVTVLRPKKSSRKREEVQERQLSFPSEIMDPEEFKQYLTKNGLSESTIEQLLSEEIDDISTLKILSEEDIEGLGLKMGQKAKLRKLVSQTVPVTGFSPSNPKSGTDTGSSNQQPRPQARKRTTLSKTSDNGVENKEQMKQPEIIPEQTDSSLSPSSGVENKEQEKQPEITTEQTDSSSSSSEEDDDGMPGARKERRDSRQQTFSKSKKTEVALDYHCLLADDKGKVVIDLSTEHQDEIDPPPAKILLLVDISGSMGIKLGRRRQYSKLSKMRKFAEAMVESLDDGDHVALVTFGKDAEVLLPLQEITSKSRADLRRVLEKLDKAYLSTKTNLSAGLSKAVEVLHQASNRQEDLLNYRNAIIVFSDGEINEGTTTPGKLVHEVREKIRSTSYGLDDSQNQWVTISVVVTGNEVSEAMYMLSKYCSSEAFYHLDVEKANSEMELFLPVMLRKSAVAWNVSLHAESLNGATIINEETTQEHKVRLRDNPRTGTRSKKAFLYYDIPAATSKHLGIAVDLKNANQDPEAEVLRLDVAYTGLSRKRRNFSKTIKRREFYDTDKDKRASAITANMMHDARLVSQNALQKAADHVKSGNTSASSDDILSGKSDLQKLLDKYGKMADTAEESHVENVRPQIVAYADVLMKNMENLLDGLTNIGTSGESESKQWMKIKAVDSAISREAPTISSTVVDEADYLAPMPNLKRISGNLQGQLENLYQQKGGRPSPRSRTPKLDPVVE